MPRACSCLLLLLLPSDCVALIALEGARGARCITPPARACILRASAQPVETPDEMLGPWELASSVSGLESTWIELHEGGKVSCARAVGRGRSWGATRASGRWRLRAVLLDKLERPMAYEGTVEADDRRRQVISGDLYHPEAKTSDALGFGKGRIVGKFTGYQLE
jgi:hypothetical protein